MNLSELHLHWRNSKYKGNTYNSYSLARAFRENGKNKKDIVFKLGKLSDEDIAHWRNFLKAVKNPAMFFTGFEYIDTLNHYAYLDIAVINEIWNELELDTPFNSEPLGSDKTIRLSDIARILTINRCINPSSKFKIPEWVKTTWLPWMLDINSEQINPSCIYRSLIPIEDSKERICKHLFALLERIYPESMNTIFYDLSSTTFSGTKCILMNWGHCKEGYQNHIVLALVVNQDGLPFYWEVFPGNTADANTIKWLKEEIQTKFPSINTTLVFDRGMVSDENLSILEDDGFKYISAMDRNQIVDITGMDFKNFSHFDPAIIENQLNDLPDFEELNHSTYYREVKVENKRRYILCFNPVLFKDQRKAREKSIVNFKEFVNELNKELLQVKNSRNKKSTQAKFNKQLAKLKLKSFISVSLEEINLPGKNKKGKGKTRISYQAHINPVDKQKLMETQKLDGFWLLVTNHYEQGTDGNYNLSASDAINPYREKTMIESAFRDIKSFVEIEPIYVWLVKHVKAHYTVCVLAYFINRLVSMRLHQNIGNISKHIISHIELYQKLKDCMVDKIQIKNLNLSAFKRSHIDELKQELIQRLNLTTLFKDKSIKQANEKL